MPNHDDVDNILQRRVDELNRLIAQPRVVNRPLRLRDAPAFPNYPAWMDDIEVYLTYVRVKNHRAFDPHKQYQVVRKHYPRHGYVSLRSDDGDDLLFNLHYDEIALNKKDPIHLNLPSWF